VGRAVAEEGVGGVEGGAEVGGVQAGSGLVNVADALKGWTGKTPKKMLEEFVQKNKLNRAKFETISLNPARSKVTVGSLVCLGAEDIQCSKVAEAEHVVAAQALFKLAQVFQ
jgi:hypothetical protein